MICGHDRRRPPIHALGAREYMAIIWGTVDGGGEAYLKEGGGIMVPDVAAGEEDGGRAARCWGVFWVVLSASC